MFSGEHDISLKVLIGMKAKATKKSVSVASVRRYLASIADICCDPAMLMQESLAHWKGIKMPLRECRKLIKLAQAK